MKKLTRKSLDELARTMQIVDENEQMILIGGDDYYLKQDGTWTVVSNCDPYDRLISPDGKLSEIVYRGIMEQMQSRQYTYQNYEEEEERTLHYCISPDKSTLDCVFQFLAQNTSVEWLQYDSVSGDSLLYTQHLQHGVNPTIISHILKNEREEFQWLAASVTHSHPSKYNTLKDEEESMKKDNELYVENYNDSKSLDYHSEQFVLFSHSGNLWRLSKEGPILVKKG